MSQSLDSAIAPVPILVNHKGMAESALKSHPSPNGTLARPFLKWAGGKSQLLSQYQPFFPTNYATYYEPFLGGGAVFFHLHPPQARLMDINPELVNVYQCVQQHLEAVIAELERHHSNHSAEYYYHVRAQRQGSAVERAARLMYLNKTCFNGLYRENSKGEFNVPMGRYKNPKICDRPLLESASIALQSAQIEVAPFDAVLNWATTDQDFVYFDPPYHPISATSSFTAYNRYDFREADQLRLRDAFVELAGRGVKVMLSNSDCPLIRELYQGFPMQAIAATRAINSNVEKRGKISELLVMSYTQS